MNTRLKENIEGYLYILLALFIYAFSIIKNVQFNLRDLGRPGAPFMGLMNYRFTSTDKLLFISLKNNFNFEMYKDDNQETVPLTVMNIGIEEKIKVCYELSIQSTTNRTGGKKHECSIR